MVTAAGAATRLPARHSARADPGEVDRTDTERKLGRWLPDDFKRLVAGYGESVPEGLSLGDPAEHTQWFTVLDDHEQPPFPMVMCGGTEGGDLVGWNATAPNPNA